MWTSQFFRTNHWADHTLSRITITSGNSTSKHQVQMARRRCQQYRGTTVGTGREKVASNGRKLAKLPFLSCSVKCPKRTLQRITKKTRHRRVGGFTTGGIGEILDANQTTAQRILGRETTHMRDCLWKLGMWTKTKHCIFVKVGKSELNHRKFHTFCLAEWTTLGLVSGC